MEENRKYLEDLRRRTVPTGFDFNPSDRTLITEYLVPYIKGESLPNINVIHRVDIYLHHPQFFRENYVAQEGEHKDDKWYFFTPRIRKYPNGKRPSRSTVGEVPGYWKSTGSDAEILGKLGEVVGYRKALVFYEGIAPNHVKTQWMMHEFKVPQVSEAGGDKKTAQLDEVLCKIYYKDKEKESKDKEKESKKEGEEEIEGMEEHDEDSIMALLKSPTGFSSHDLLMEKNRNYLEAFLNYTEKTLPHGFEFFPSDRTLIFEFLLPKIHGLDMPNDVIHCVDIYHLNPEVLPEKYKPQQDEDEVKWYLFTPLDRRYPNGKRPSRSTIGGYWKATGSDKKIKDEHDNTVALCKVLVFYEGKPPKGLKTQWIMKEFRIAQNFAAQGSRKRKIEGDMRLDDCVLCKIHHHTKKGPKKKGSESQKLKEKVGEETYDADNMISFCGDQEVPVPLRGSKMDLDQVVVYGSTSSHDYGSTSNQVQVQLQLMMMDNGSTSHQVQAVNDYGSTSYQVSPNNCQILPSLTGSDFVLDNYEHYYMTQDHDIFYQNNYEPMLEMTTTMVPPLHDSYSQPFEFQGLPPLSSSHFPPGSYMFSDGPSNFSTLEPPMFNPGPSNYNNFNHGSSTFSPRPLNFIPEPSFNPGPSNFNNFNHGSSTLSPIPLNFIPEPSFNPGPSNFDPEPSLNPQTSLLSHPSVPLNFNTRPSNFTPQPSRFSHESGSESEFESELFRPL